MRIFAFTFLMLAGCATPRIEYIREPVEVLVPIAQPCPVTAPGFMEYATEFLTLESDDFEKIRAVLVERRQRSVVEEELRALLEVCIHFNE